MTPSEHRKPPTTLTDLPPELCAAIVSRLQDASSIATLAATSKSLKAFVQKDGWKIFAKTRFPTLCPRESPSFYDTARTLTTLSRAWDRRAFVARNVEPQGNITAFPGARNVPRWKRPRGQTIGFTPHLDVYEKVNSTWYDREETLAFSAGAQICIRQTQSSRGVDNEHWFTYRPFSAAEGRDDVTTLHLVAPAHHHEDTNVEVVTGTANGDLQLLRLSVHDVAAEVSITYFTTQGLPVRSSSLLRRDGQPSLLAANLGDTRTALYQLDAGKNKISPSSQIEIHPFIRPDGNPAPHHRVWGTSFLSSATLAMGVGPSETPLHVYQVAESGLVQAPLRKFGLIDIRLECQVESKKRTSSAIYTTRPLPSSTGSSGDGNVFLSGAYDGIVRLHDMRSNRDVEQSYVDPADDSAVYSILPRGQEKLITGTSRHQIIKVFDLRLGAKCYSVNDMSGQDCDYNVFLTASNQPSTSGNNWRPGRNRSSESSVYSLASPSASSPFVYAGVENTIWSLAFTEVLDPNPDPAYFDPWSTGTEARSDTNPRIFRSREVQGLAMYNQRVDMDLSIQRSLEETWNACAPRRKEAQPVLDERWKGASEF